MLVESVFHDRTSLLELGLDIVSVLNSSDDVLIEAVKQI